MFFAVVVAIWRWRSISAHGLNDERRSKEERGTMNKEESDDVGGGDDRGSDDVMGHRGDDEMFATIVVFGCGCGRRDVGDDGDD